jgi:xanthine dehydrogenase accessory factor
MALFVILRGGGDLASGVALRLYRAGLRLIITELAQPLSVRRLVSFSEAVFEGQKTVEGVQACLASDLNEALALIKGNQIPILVDPSASSISALRNLQSEETPIVLVDARMTKRPPERGTFEADLVIGLGPGFVAGENCHAVIETNRGHSMGRVIWKGAAEADTRVPEQVVDQGTERVLRAPAAGILETFVRIGDHLEPGQLVAEVGGQPLKTPFRGVLRGLIHPGLQVWQGMKVGDVDPRDNPEYTRLVSDKSLAVGGGVLEAILSRPELRPYLWPDQTLLDRSEKGA